MNDRELPVKLEALLFALGRPLSRIELSQLFDASAEQIEQAIKQLLREGSAHDRGIILVDDGREVELRVAPLAAELAAEVRRDELSRDVGRAGAEVLAVLLYKGPATRTAIDFIRGVNSSASLRTLLMRGLARRRPGDEGTRSALYEVTTETLGFLGLQKVEDAAEYAAIRERLHALERTGG